jgi:hypothetical protein
MGAGLPPRGGSLHPPRPQPRRRWRRRRLGQAQEHPPPGHLRERRRAPRKCRRAPRRRPGVRRCHTGGGDNVRLAPEEEENGISTLR